MNEKERKDLALSKVILLTLAFIAIVVVVWLAWMRPATGSAYPVVSPRHTVEVGPPLIRSLL